MTWLDIQRKKKVDKHRKLLTKDINWQCSESKVHNNTSVGTDSNTIKIENSWTVEKILTSRREMHLGVSASFAVT